MKKKYRNICSSIDSLVDIRLSADPADSPADPTKGRTLLREQPVQISLMVNDVDLLEHYM